MIIFPYTPNAEINYCLSFDKYVFFNPLKDTSFILYSIIYLSKYLLTIYKLSDIGAALGNTNKY